MDAACVISVVKRSDGCLDDSVGDVRALDAGFLSVLPTLAVIAAENGRFGAFITIILIYSRQFDQRE